jgi:hypothetical protein
MKLAWKYVLDVRVRRVRTSYKILQVAVRKAFQSDEHVRFSGTGGLQRYS